MTDTLRPAWLACLVVFCVAGLGCSEDPDQGLLFADTGDIYPLVTWATFGEGFVRDHCQVCHSSTAPDRHGAPKGVHFDTEDETLRRASRILERVTGQGPNMPPGGGVPANDLLLLEAWLAPYAD